MSDPRFGIEEEYFITDLHSREMVGRPPAEAIEACKAAMGDAFASEMFQGQIEVASPVFTDFSQASDYLRRARQTLSAALEPFGLGLLCAGSHPLADWRDQVPTAEAHFIQLFQDYGHVARRSVLSGLHVHVEVPPPFDRIRVMNQVLPWTPLLLALSCSSALWDGADSGFMSYRQVACGEWPRMGVPPMFVDQRDYDGHIAFLSEIGTIHQPSECWWGIRPAVRYPTLELRMTDACPRVEDALTLAGLFRVLVTHAMEQAQPGATYDLRARAILEENHWRAKRFGIHGRFIVPGSGTECTAEQWLGMAQLQFAETARQLRMPLLFEHASNLIAEGTSADRQLAVFNQALKQHGARSALSRVTALLLEETAAG
ncbi:carboxylate-amine ligase [Pseudomonas sp. SWRI111]|uniref:carboxylate-amine ligase n=1 Tax=Pseudomonas sp. SWRI111 TaxID=2745507 RepID=UPI0016483531|nr:carboxylate-amine ligase [Pseudomonas sp. SWRI111]MBC3207465.1 carboxylate-amine ligase [Pseudomonas sp. SWRI111]